MYSLLFFSLFEGKTREADELHARISRLKRRAKDEDISSHGSKREHLEAISSIENIYIYRKSTFLWSWWSWRMTQRLNREDGGTNGGKTLPITFLVPVGMNSDNEWITLLHKPGLCARPPNEIITKNHEFEIHDYRQRDSGSGFLGYIEVKWARGHEKQIIF